MRHLLQTAMTEAGCLLVWAAAFVLSGSLLAWPLGKSIENRWPALGTPVFIALGLGALVLSWTAAAHISAPPPATCREVFDRTDALSREARSEFLARCVATAAQDEIGPAVLRPLRTR
jgi:hypothetical protein